MKEALLLVSHTRLTWVYKDQVLIECTVVTVVAEEPIMIDS